MRVVGSRFSFGTVFGGIVFGLLAAVSVSFAQGKAAPGAMPKKGPKKAEAKKVLPIDVAMRTFDEAIAKGMTGDELAKATNDLAASARANPVEKFKQQARARFKGLLKRRGAETRKIALDGYRELAMPGTSRDIRQFVDPKRNKRMPVEVRQASLLALGEIQDPKTFGTLLDYIRVPNQDPAAIALAVTAAEALSGYDKLEKQNRYTFLKETMKVFNAIYSAGGGSFAPSAAASVWWGKLQEPMTAAFNAVAKTEFTNYRDCWTWWKQNHRDVRAGRK